jgi:Tfp pilus assembly protein PilZ
MDERRGHERFNEVFRAEIRERDTNLPVGLIADISSGGMLLRTDAARAPGEDLDLVVVVPGHGHAEREVPVQARVRWCEPDMAPGAYVIGMTFRGATQPDGPVAMSLIRLLKGIG